MSKIEYLNVDEIEPKVHKVVKLKGVEHPFHNAKVGEFIEEMKRIKSLQKKAKGDQEISEIEVMEMMLDSMRASIKGAFPTITDEMLAELTYDQVSAIQKFITTQFEEDSVEAEDESGNV